MRTTQLYVEDPWDVASYRTKLHTLYRAMHGLRKRSKVDASKVRTYTDWLVPRVDELYKYMKQQYTNISVLSSMMLPVASVLRRELGQDHPTAAKWREEATELRIDATQETSHNKGDEDFKTYEEICRRRDSLKQQEQQDSDQSTNTIVYWQWFALCLYTLQPPLRADWANLAVIDTRDKAASPDLNYLILTPSAATILIQHDKVSQGDKVSKSRGGAQIPVHPDLHAVLVDSLRRFPRSFAVPHIESKRKEGQSISYCPDTPINKIKLSQLLAQAMASPHDNTPWTRPIHRLRAAHSTHVKSSPVSYHTIQSVASAQRHSVSTLLCHYRVLPGSSMQQGHDEQASKLKEASKTTQESDSLGDSLRSILKQKSSSIRDYVLITKEVSGSEGDPPRWTISCSSPHLQASAEECISRLPRCP